MTTHLPQRWQGGQCLLPATQEAEEGPNIKSQTRQGGSRGRPLTWYVCFRTTEMPRLWSQTTERALPSSRMMYRPDSTTSKWVSSFMGLFTFTWRRTNRETGKGWTGMTSISYRCSTPMPSPRPSRTICLQYACPCPSCLPRSKNPLRDENRGGSKTIIMIFKIQGNQLADHPSLHKKNFLTFDH